MRCVFPLFPLQSLLTESFYCFQRVHSPSWECNDICEATFPSRPDFGKMQVAVRGFRNNTSLQSFEFVRPSRSHLIAKLQEWFLNRNFCLRFMPPNLSWFKPAFLHSLITSRPNSVSECIRSLPGAGDRTNFVRGLFDTWSTENKRKLKFRRAVTTKIRGMSLINHLQKWKLTLDSV